MRKSVTWVLERRGLSPIFATVILVTIVVVLGSFTYYFANNLTTSATHSYTSTLSNSQHSVSERLAIENVNYAYSTAKLSVYLINCGMASNVQIDSVYLYDASHNIVGQPYVKSQITIQSIDSGTPIAGNRLNVGQDGYFTVSASLQSGSLYTVHIVTNSGSGFEYDFTA